MIDSHLLSEPPRPLRTPRSKTIGGSRTRSLIGEEGGRDASTMGSDPDGCDDGRDDGRDGDVGDGGRSETLKGRGPGPCDNVRAGFGARVASECRSASTCSRRPPARSEGRGDRCVGGSRGRCGSRRVRGMGLDLAASIVVRRLVRESCVREGTRSPVPARAAVTVSEQPLLLSGNSRAPSRGITMHERIGHEFRALY